MNRLIAASCAAGLLVLGCGGLGSLLDSEPTLQAVAIHTDYPGASPEEVEHTITIPIEASVASVAGVQRVQSRTVEGGSVVTVWYEPRTTDGYALRAALLEQLQQTASMLPAEAESSWLGNAHSSERLLARVAITGSEGWQRCATSMAQAATTVAGVEYAELVGLAGDRMVVQVDTARLGMVGLTLDQLQLALSGASSEFAADGFLLRASSAPSSIEELANTVVTMADELPVRLSDIASIRVEQDPQAPMVLLDGQPAALLSIHPQPGAARATVLDKLAPAMERAQAQCPASLISQNMAPSAMVLAVEIETPATEGIDRELAERIQALSAVVEPSDVLLELGRPSHTALDAPRPERARLMLRFDAAPPERTMQELVGSLRTQPELEVLSWEGPGSRLELLLEAQEHALLPSIAATLAEQLFMPGHETAVDDGRLPDSPQITIQADRERLAALGSSQAQLAESARAAMACLPVELGVGGAAGAMPVVLCSTAPGDSPMQSLLYASIRTPDGRQVPITEVASIEISSAPGALDREDLGPAIRLQITSTEPRERKLREAVMEQVLQLELPPGVSVELVL